MAQSAPEEFEFIVERDGEQRTLRGVREGKSPYVRLDKRFHALHPAVKAAVQNAKDRFGVQIGKGVNNVWVAVGSEESGDDSVQRGEHLLANIRIEKRTGGFVIAAGVALGVVVAMKLLDGHTKNRK